MLREILEDEGYAVVDAEDGEEGVRVFREEPADLVITDLLMPQKDGLETIQELRGFSPEVKIIAISGGGRLVSKDYAIHPTVRHIAQKFGAQRVFSKPIEKKELLNAIAELLE